MGKEKIIGIDNRLLNQIIEIKKYGNFQTIKKEIGEERLKDFINSIYPKFSITEIERITGIPDSTLEYWFQELKIPFVRNHIYNVSIPGEINSQIIIQKGTITEKVSTIKITPPLAYVIGFTLGDGSIQKWMIEVFNKDRNLRQVLFDYLKPYGSITDEERQNGLWRLRLSNVNIANLIKNENGIRQDTLDYIFNNDDLARNFIAAFWDAEGSVLRQIKRNKNYYHIYLYNSNKYLINKICMFLKSNEIIFSILERKTRDKDTIMNGRVIKSKKNLIRINIHKKSWIDWINQIGLLMNHTKKKEMIKDIIKFMGVKNG